MRSVIAVAVLLTTAVAEAKVVSVTIPYRHDDVELEGVLFHDDAKPGKLPAVLVVHEWWGLNDFAREKARGLAELGYAAFAVDMYGKGRATNDPGEAGKLAGPFRENAELWRRRFKATLDAVHDHPRVDHQRIAAIGFCFGGTTVLHAAAAGYDLKAVVSFHGSLPQITAEDAARIKARVLVLHGAADTLVPDAALAAFQDALRSSKADWQIVTYGGAKHGFMNAEADKLGMPGVGYDARAAQRAWREMQVLFEEALK